MTQADIARNASIPSSTMSYVMRGERELPSTYNPNLRNLYQRTAYKALREKGMSTTQARRFSWYAPSKIVEVLQQAIDIVQKISSARFAKYKEYLQSIGQYTTDEAVLESLTKAIRDAISKSDLPEERLAGIEYGTTEDY
jgi:hypothetical protein